MRLPSELSLIFMELMDSRSVPSMPADPQAASCCEPCAGARSPGSPCGRLRRDPQAGGGGGRLAPHHAAPAPSARSAATCVSQAGRGVADPAISAAMPASAITALTDLIHVLHATRQIDFRIRQKNARLGPALERGGRHADSRAARGWQSRCCGRVSEVVGCLECRADSRMVGLCARTSSMSCRRTATSTSFATVPRSRGRPRRKKSCVRLAPPAPRAPTQPGAH